MKLAKATSLLAIIILPLSVFADVEFIEPSAGSSVNSGDILTAYWKDSGDVPSLLDLYSYDLYLCAGGPEIEFSVCVFFHPDTSRHELKYTTPQEDLALLVANGLFARGYSVSFQIQPDLGPEHLDA